MPDADVLARAARINQQLADLGPDLALAAGGMAPPPFGTAVDVVSFGRDTYKAITGTGSWWDVAFSAVGFVPLAGDAAKAGKIIKKVADLADEAAKIAPDLAKLGPEGAKALDGLKDTLGGLKKAGCDTMGIKQICAALDKIDDAGDATKNAAKASPAPHASGAGAGPPSPAGVPPVGSGGSVGSTGGGAAATVPPGKAPDFVVSPGGDVIRVPDGATGPVPVINNQGKTTGFAYTGGSGGKGMDSRVDTVRIMDATPPKGNSPGYPNGYATYQNGMGQGVNPNTGKTVSNADPTRHMPLSPPKGNP